MRFLQTTLLTCAVLLSNPIQGVAQPNHTSAAPAISMDSSGKQPVPTHPGWQPQSDSRNPSPSDDKQFSSTGSSIDGGMGLLSALFYMFLMGLAVFMGGFMWFVTATVLAESAREAVSTRRAHLDQLGDLLARIPNRYPEYLSQNGPSVKVNPNPFPPGSESHRSYQQAVADVPSLYAAYAQLQDNWRWAARQAADGSLILPLGHLSAWWTAGSDSGVVSWLEKSISNAVNRLSSFHSRRQLSIDGYAELCRCRNRLPGALAEMQRLGLCLQPFEARLQEAEQSFQAAGESYLKDPLGAQQLFQPLCNVFNQLYQELCLGPQVKHNVEKRLPELQALIAAFKQTLQEGTRQEDLLKQGFAPGNFQELSTLLAEMHLLGKDLSLAMSKIQDSVRETGSFQQAEILERAYRDRASRAIKRLQDKRNCLQELQLAKSNAMDKLGLCLSQQLSLNNKLQPLQPEETRNDYYLSTSTGTRKLVEEINQEIARLSPPPAGDQATDQELQQLATWERQRNWRELAEQGTALSARLSALDDAVFQENADYQAAQAQLCELSELVDSNSGSLPHCSHHTRRLFEKIQNARDNLKEQVILPAQDWNAIYTLSVQAGKALQRFQRQALHDQTVWQAAQQRLDQAQLAGCAPELLAQTQRHIQQGEFHLVGELLWKSVIAAREAEKRALAEAKAVAEAQARQAAAEAQAQAKAHSNRNSQPEPWRNNQNDRRSR